MNRRFRPLLVLLCLLAAAPASRAEPSDDGLYAGFMTSMGEFWCRLEFAKAPRTVANFVTLAEGTRDWIDFPTARKVRRPFYPGITFHRVIAGFMIQSGSPNGEGTDGPGYRFADEFHPDLRHARAGILSMANSGPDSNGSQFFVTVTNTPWLDDRHSVFGEVVEGMAVVHAISLVPTNIQSRPLTPVSIQEIRVVRRGAAAQAFDPLAVTPPLPGIGHVPTALLVTPTELRVLLQPRANHLQHVFVSGDLSAWFANSFPNAVTNLDATSLRNQPFLFFRTLDGGFESD